MVTNRLARAAVAAACLGMMAHPRPTGGGQALSLRVTPTMAAAPALIRVSAIIESSEDNRGLELVADSAGFYRSSWIQLDGVRAPRQTVVDFQNLPPGVYEVRAVLGGKTGTRAVELTTVNVIPAPGSGR